VNHQLEELRSIKFSGELQSGLDSDITDVEYDPASTFTLLIIVQGDSDQKVVVDGFVVIKLDVHSGSAQMATVHPDVYMPVLSSPGHPVDVDVQLSRFRDLMIIGDLLNPPMPLAYTMYQIEELFALPIDGYMSFPPEIVSRSQVFSTGEVPDVEIQGSYDTWEKNWMSYWDTYLRSVSLLSVWRNRSILTDIQSSMGVVDVYSFIQEYKRISTNTLVKIDIPDDSLTETINERGETVNVVGIEAVDAAMADLDRDSQMDREQARIEIFNGTNVGGYGARYERLIRNMGGEVIRVMNAPGKSQNTRIFVTDTQKYAYTVSQISRLFAHAQVIEGRPDFVTTGDVIIVLGMDF